MSSAPDYSTATNKAYEILSKVDPFNLETDINKILSLFPNIASHTYTEIANRFFESFYDYLVRRIFLQATLSNYHTC